jgi:hypothetical protein
MKVWLSLLLFFGSLGVVAQTVQPVIVEYRGNADGKVAVTNSSPVPMVVVVEPKSFSISADGKGTFRPLDDDIHVELSSRSMVLQPGETYYVFYKAKAERLPAWFTLYASFNSMHHGKGLDLRIMLPHTVYLYQKVPLGRTDIVVKDLAYNSATKKLTAEIENTSMGLGRVQMVHASGDLHSSNDAAGFPLLPGASRQIEVDWNFSVPPNDLELRFDHFTLKQPVATYTAMK